MVRNIISLALAALFVLPVFGQTSTPGQVRDIQQGFREEAQQLRQNVKQEIQQKREEFRAQAEQKRQELKTQIETKRAEMKTQIEAKRAELKERLQKIKDEKKKQAVERIANQITELNERRLDHFSAVLGELEKVLERIVSRIEKAASRGLDVTLPRTEAENAKTAIAAAREAIKAQADKVYTVLSATSTESGLKIEVGNVRQAFHSDLKKVEAAVKAARDAVHNIATTLAKIRGVNEEPPVTPTSTATSTP